VTARAQMHCGSAPLLYGPGRRGHDRKRPRSRNGGGKSPMTPSVRQPRDPSLAVLGRMLKRVARLYGEPRLAAAVLAASADRPLRLHCGHHAALPRTAAPGTIAVICTAAKHPLYSITSSATASSAGGTVRPSALAVFRLMTSSYLVGCCTGRSPGFSPLKMRSTYEAVCRYISNGFAP